MGLSVMAMPRGGWFWSIVSRTVKLKGGRRQNLTPNRAEAPKVQAGT